MVSVESDDCHSMMVWVKSVVVVDAAEWVLYFENFEEEVDGRTFSSDKLGLPFA